MVNLISFPSLYSSDLTCDHLLVMMMLVMLMLMMTMTLMCDKDYDGDEDDTNNADDDEIVYYLPLTGLPLDFDQFTLRF